ncbi:hypothetical protein PTTG_08539, partial [Puccinia triticina 1-1 BBBD Race 1]
MPALLLPVLVLLASQPIQPKPLDAFLSQLTPRTCPAPQPPPTTTTENQDDQHRRLLSFSEWKTNNISSRQPTCQPATPPPQPPKPPQPQPPKPLQPKPLAAALNQSDTLKLPILYQPNPHTGTGNSNDPLKILSTRTNYASFDCSASIHRASKHTKSPSAILNEKKDKYLLTPCKQPNSNNREAASNFVVFELCDEIEIHHVVLANFEFFSSMFKLIRMSVSNSALEGIRRADWVDVGFLKTHNTRGFQVFPIKHLKGFYRYVRLDFLTHYGSEYYCPLSLVRIYGLTQIDAYRRDEKLEQRSKVEEEQEESVIQQEEAAEQAEKLPLEPAPPPHPNHTPTSTANHFTTPTHEPPAEHDHPPIPAPAVKEEPSSSYNDPGTSNEAEQSTADESSHTSLEPADQAPEAEPDTHPESPPEHDPQSASIPQPPPPLDSSDEPIPIAPHPQQQQQQQEDNSPAPATTSTEDLAAAREPELPTPGLPSTDLPGTTATATGLSSQRGGEAAKNTPSTAPDPAHTMPIIRGEAAKKTPSTGPDPAHTKPIIIGLSKPTIPPEKLAHPPPPPPPANPAGQGSESIFGQIMKRLNSLESNHLLLLKYTEDQVHVLGSSSHTLELRLSELEKILKLQTIKHEETVQEIQALKRQMTAERAFQTHRIESLDSSITFIKRIGLVQSVSILALLVFLSMTRLQHSSSGASGQREERRASMAGAQAGRRGSSPRISQQQRTPGAKKPGPRRPGSPSAGKAEQLFLVHRKLGYAPP